jgi:hypothetical protein
MSETGSAFEQLIETVRSALHAKRRDTVARVEKLQGALDTYAASLEEQIAAAYAAEHGLRRPVTLGNPRAAALALLRAVQELPELAPDSSAERAPEPPPEGVVADVSEPYVAPSAWPHLLAAALRAPVVIVGGVSRTERLAELPDKVRAAVEWIDTTRQGTHAIGNLERRIKDRRLAALIVLEAVISHRHSDPLLSAARHVGLPCAYAGKGGKASLTRAFGELELALGKARA